MTDVLNHPDLQWTTQTRKVKDLIPFHINPRKISRERLQSLSNLISKFNVVEIPVIDIDNTLLTYHQRLKALMMLGRGEDLIDVRVPNRKLTDHEMKEYNLVANTHAGEFDISIFDEHYGDIDLASLGLTMGDIDINIKIDELTNVEKSVRQDAVEDDYVVPDEIKTDIREGDLIQIGRHFLLCGDARRRQDWEKLCQGKTLDLLVLDPPYNVDYVGKTKDAMKIQNDSMDSAAYQQFLLTTFCAMDLFVRPGAVWYVWHADSEGHTIRNAFIEAGMKLSQNLIWKKNAMVMGRQDYHWQHEPCLYGWKPGAAHNWFADRTQTTILEFDRPARNEKHPTMKPVPLISYLINNSSRPGEIVGDCFVGSGTTMVTCHQTDRICLAMELDPRFCQVTVERMHQLDASLPVLRNGVPMQLPIV